MTPTWGQDDLVLSQNCREIEFVENMKSISQNCREYESKFQKSNFVSLHWKLDNPYYHNLRKREVALARISLYIVLVFLLCHIIRIIPNAYEMIQSYNLGVSMIFVYQLLKGFRSQNVFSSNHSFDALSKDLVHVGTLKLIFSYGSLMQKLWVG